MARRREPPRIVDISAHRRADISSIRGRAESIGTFYIYQRFTYQPFISETAGGGDSSLYATANTAPSAFSLRLLLLHLPIRVFLFFLRLSYVTSNLYVLHATVCTSFLLSFRSFFFLFYLKRRRRFSFFEDTSMRFEIEISRGEIVLFSGLS